jgi:hypothetical protein
MLPEDVFVLLDLLDNSFPRKHAFFFRQEMTRQVNATNLRRKQLIYCKEDCLM